MNFESAKQLTDALKKLARQDSSLHVNELRIIVALERAIARLQYDRRLAKHLIFKGGFVLLKHFASQRFTRDADALAVSISKEDVEALVRSALSQDLNDGLWYGDVQAKNLAEQGKYGALRFDSAFQIGEPNAQKIHKLSRIHIDIGFSDQLLINATDKTMPPLFSGGELISWRVYPIEQIIAEKLETLFQRGIGNSRAKDIYDLTHLIPRCKDKKRLLLSIQHTFKNRGTALPLSFSGGAQEIDDLSILQAAWPGVRTLKNKSSFAEAWSILLECLKDLDKNKPAK